MLVPFVDACHTSIDAFFTGSPVSALVILPYIQATSPSVGVSKVIVVPLARMGVSLRQNGPRIAVAVTGWPLFTAAECVISSTRLVAFVRRGTSRPRIKLTILGQ